MELKAVLFDLDGTLVNTAPDMVGALNRLLEANNKPLVDYAEASQLVSNGGRALVLHGFGNQLEEKQIDQYVNDFLIT